MHLETDRGRTELPKIYKMSKPFFWSSMMITHVNHTNDDIYMHMDIYINIYILWVYILWLTHSNRRRSASHLSKPDKTSPICLGNFTDIDTTNKHASGETSYLTFASRNIMPLIVHLFVDIYIQFSAFPLDLASLQLALKVLGPSPCGRPVRGAL